MDKKHRNNLSMDSSKILFIRPDELTLENNHIKWRKRKFTTIPSISASTAIVLEYLKMRQELIQVAGVENADILPGN